MPDASLLCAAIPHENNMILDVVLEGEDEEEDRGEQQGEPEEPKLVHMPLAPHVSTMHPVVLSNQPPSDSVPSEDGKHLMLQEGEESKPGSPAPMSESTASGHREFKVKGRLQEDEDKLNLRLRIIQPHCELPCNKLHAHPSLFSQLPSCTVVADR